MNSTLHCSGLWYGNKLAEMSICPAGVNLNALPTRLVSTCCRPDRVADQKFGEGGGRSRNAAPPRTDPRSTGTDRTPARMPSPTLKGTCWTDSFPASTLERSKMSVSKFVSLLEDWIASVTYPVCSAFSSDPCSNCSMPRMPFSGRPDLMAHVGQKLGLGTAEGLGFLLGLLQSVPGRLAVAEIFKRGYHLCRGLILVYRIEFDIDICPFVPGYGSVIILIRGRLAMQGLFQGPSAWPNCFASGY